MYRIAVYLMLFLSACTLSRKDEPVNTLQAGVASAPINPPVGAFIAGDKQNRTFTGVHDSLFAKAVVVDDGRSVLALVTLDCIGLLYPEVQQIRATAAAHTGIPEERIIISSTHTHSGPDVVGIWGPDYQHSGVDTSYMNFLVTTAARQVKQAYENRQPVTALVAETTFGEEWVQNICEEEIDRSVSVMQFVNPRGESVATLTNFACHPTYLDARFSEVSADYVGGFYRRMQQLAGGDNLFFQGAIGGWVQPVDGEGSFDKATRRGFELATAVAEALATADTLVDFTLQFDHRKVRLPVNNPAWKQLSEIGTIRRTFTDSVETEVAWFAIGPVQFATHPGETTPYLGLETKRLMKTGPRFVLGLGLDALGYILKPEYFEDPTRPHAEYLTGMSLGKETSPIIWQALQQIIPEDLLANVSLSKE